MPISQKLDSLDERDFTLNLKGGHGFHTCKLLASLVITEARKKFTQLWIEGREANVTLSRNDNGQLCIRVMLTVTLPKLIYSVYNFYPIVSHYNGACFHMLRAFCVSFSENCGHNLCLLFYCFVCFYSLICRNSLFIREISPLIYGLPTFFPVCHRLCVWL